MTFEDLSLPPESHWNGSDGSGGFYSGGAFFANAYDSKWESWSGFAYSNRTDAETRDVDGQYTAIAGSGYEASNTYGVAFVGWEEPPAVTLDTPGILRGIHVTNDCFAYYSMLEGSMFSKRFGGPTGADPDWFMLSITGIDAAGEATGTVDFYLADLRPPDSNQDYILDSWQFVDLTPLGEVRTLHFALASSDTGTFGMNTPGYFCIDTLVPQVVVTTFDDLTLAPESYWNGADGSGGFVSGQASFENRYNAEWEFWDGFAYSNRTDANSTGNEAQYTAIAGGQGGSPGYAVAFVGWETPPALTFANPQRFTGLYVTNNGYAYYDMRDGSPFSKKFGGDTGDDEDWLKLTITSIDANDLPTGAVEFYLADLRFADNAQDYILDSWAFVDLTSLGEVQTLRFALSSSDTGDFGMNTPAYFCIDTLVSGSAEAPEAVDEQAAPAATLWGDESCQGR